MEVLDTSIANVALPYIAGSLSASVDESVWVLTSYLVANAIVLPMSGWISERMGRKRYHLLSVILFTISSFFCGIAPTLPLLIIFRILQGLGGGGLQPTTQAILADVFPKEKIVAAFTMYSFVIVLGPTLGPLLGGWLSDNWGWRWIFFLNVPCGIVGYLLNRSLQPEMKAPRRTEARIDYIGLVTISLGLGCLEYVLDRGERFEWFSSPAIRTCAIVSVVSLIVMVFYELWHAKNPIVQLRLLGNRNFLLAVLFMFFAFFCRFASTALFPEFTHGMLGYTATDSGLVLSPGSLVLLFFLPATAWLMKRVDHRVLIAIGLSITSFAFFCITNISLYVDYRTIVRLRILESCGVALFLTPLSVLAFSQLRTGKNDAAASLLGLFRNLGSAIGISIVNTMLVRRVQVHRNYLVANLTTGSNPLDNALTVAHTQLRTWGGLSQSEARAGALGLVNEQLNQQATVLTYMDCFRLLMWISLILLPFVYLLIVRKQKLSAEEAAHALAE
jgi:DHA2 family multidrug resistance protein